ncbi:FAD/NAD(P)-binding protein [Phytohalomonas tamaricis]|uniref:FAD/NAD(P)-binding protein n=1 Tax=Phytohalomonas tamaricis TaxID=2081032 RepID=UPI000D0B2AA9|nr:FAD/NAD(P)-binding protein [Phytohalomonas tamaricis]
MRKAPHIVIVGGGLVGSAVAWHLCHLLTTSAAITVIEPRTTLGAGLAYSSRDPAHRLNVPITRMSLLPDDPTHFQRWYATHHLIEHDPEAALADGRIFARRSDFGYYMQAQLAPLLATGQLSHRCTRAMGIAPRGTGYRLELEGGEALNADLVVLAMTHTPPTAPGRLAEILRDHPRFIADPWRPDALKTIRADDRVLLLGTGLTMADTLASLTRQGHRGSVTALSRRGRLPASQTTIEGDGWGDFSTAPATTALTLVERTRTAILDAQSHGRPWQHVFDALREQAPRVWGSLPLKEKRRFLRHLRPWWDSGRFRIAPQTQSITDQRREASTLDVLAARIVDASIDDEVIRLHISPRHCDQLIVREFDALVLNTGPGHERLFVDSPLLASLHRQGLGHPDECQLGIAVDNDSCVLDQTGHAQPRLRVAGPLARGRVGELMGVPQVTLHAQTVAMSIAQMINEKASQTSHLR